MADIAAHAGVSTATVSRVFNGVGQVSKETKLRVLTAIDQLGYERPSPEMHDAKPVIGIILPELTNPIFASYAHAFHTEISHAGGVAHIASQTPGTASEDAHIAAFINRGVSGLVFISGRHADYQADLSRYHELTRRSVPFVTINGARPEIAAPDFSTGDDIGIRVAVSHLRALGHTRIALLGGQTHLVPARRKADAFRSVMMSEYSTAAPTVVETFYTYEAAASAARALLASGATAIIAGSDIQALGAIQTISFTGLAVPGDVSVVGFDDSVLMSHLAPPLTTIHQPVQAITAAAVQSLMSSITTKAPQEHVDYVYTPDLVVRASTGPVHDQS